MGAGRPSALPVASVASPTAARRAYEVADRVLAGDSASDIGIELRLASHPADLDADALAGFAQRHRTITSFQDSALAVFRASMDGDLDPGIARAVLTDVPLADALGWHRRLTDAEHHRPAFFRTDELAPGVLSEVQCCGSGWDLLGAVWEVHECMPEVFGPPTHGFVEPSRSVATMMAEQVGGDPVVHHLLDNASRPHGMRAFVQQTRRHGVRYFTYDADVGPRDCNFVRSHDFISLANHNFMAERMERARRGEVRFDLPPSALFDNKLILSWPFWAPTRHVFADEVRSLLPYTAPVERSGVALESGQRVPLRDLLGTGTSHGDVYVKYAGCDVALNWGSRAVYRAGSLSQPQALALDRRVAADVAAGRPWIVQSSVREKGAIRYWQRSGEETEVDAYDKWNGFYGPGGLVGVMGFHRANHKVHGADDTIVSLVR